MRAILVALLPILLVNNSFAKDLCENTNESSIIFAKNTIQTINKTSWLIDKSYYINEIIESNCLIEKSINIANLINKINKEKTFLEKDSYCSNLDKETPEPNSGFMCDNLLTQALKSETKGNKVSLPSETLFSLTPNINSYNNFIRTINESPNIKDKEIAIKIVKNVLYLLNYTKSLYKIEGEDESSKKLLKLNVLAVQNFNKILDNQNDFIKMINSKEKDICSEIGYKNESCLNQINMRYLSSLIGITGETLAKEEPTIKNQLKAFYDSEDCYQNREILIRELELKINESHSSSEITHLKNKLEKISKATSEDIFNNCIDYKIESNQMLLENDPGLNNIKNYKILKKSKKISRDFHQLHYYNN